MMLSVPCLGRPTLAATGLCFFHLLTDPANFSAWYYGVHMPESYRFSTPSYHVRQATYGGNGHLTLMKRYKVSQTPLFYKEKPHSLTNRALLTGGECNHGTSKLRCPVPPVEPWDDQPCLMTDTCCVMTSSREDAATELIWHL